MKKIYLIKHTRRGQPVSWFVAGTHTTLSIDHAAQFTSKAKAQLEARVLEDNLEYPRGTPFVTVVSMFKSGGIVL